MMLRVPMSSAKIGSPCGFFFVLAAGTVSAGTSFLTALFLVFFAAAFVLLLRGLFAAVLAAAFVPGFLPLFLATGFAVPSGASFAAAAAASSAPPSVYFASGLGVTAGFSSALSVSLGMTLPPDAALETTDSVARLSSSFAFTEVFLVLGIE